MGWFKKAFGFSSKSITSLAIGSLFGPIGVVAVGGSMLAKSFGGKVKVVNDVLDNPFLDESDTVASQSKNALEMATKGYTDVQRDTFDKVYDNIEDYYHVKGRSGIFKNISDDILGIDKKVGDLDTNALKMTRKVTAKYKSGNYDGGSLSSLYETNGVK